MTKYWAPDRVYLDSIAAKCDGMRLVLDVGGNANYSFPAATHVVGWAGDIHLDLSREPLPFEDNSVDFVFCRHTVEDLTNPEFLLGEIARVAKAGYIETPSPLVETTRHVDFTGSHLGYMHHRWMCYDNGGVFTCLAKYPIVERLPLKDSWGILCGAPTHWNTRFLFKRPMKYVVLQNESGFDMRVMDERGIPVEYLEEVERAQNEYMGIAS